MNSRESIHRLAIVIRGEAALRCIRAVKSLRAQEGSQLSAVALYTEVVCWLATRASYVNGSVIHVNGGMYGG